jgi:hypothetical protein
MLLGIPILLLRSEQVVSRIPQEVDPFPLSATPNIKDSIRRGAFTSLACFRSRTVPAWRDCRRSLTVFQYSFLKLAFEILPFQKEAGRGISFSVPCLRETRLTVQKTSV